MRKTLTVKLEKDESNAWTATVKELPGVVTHGRSLAQVRSRVREAIWSFTDNKTYAYSVELKEDIELPPQLMRLVRVALMARTKALAASEEADVVIRQAVRTLSRKLSVRDMGELLGVTGQRVHQLREKRERRASL